MYIVIYTTYLSLHTYKLVYVCLHCICKCFAFFFCRPVGIYFWSVIKICKRDISRFLLFFAIVLFIFMGSFYLALRAGVVVTSDGRVLKDMSRNPLDTL